MPVRYKLDDDGSNDESTEGHVAAQQDPGKPHKRAFDDGSGDDAEGRGRRLP
jgi:hypothetical protein